MFYFVPVMSAVAVLIMFVAAMRMRAEKPALVSGDAANDDGPEVSFMPPLEERAERGLCRIPSCPQKAEFRAPRVVNVRPMLDVLLRRLGATPTVKFQLRMDPTDIDAPVDLCAEHRELARCALEIELGEIPSRYARLNNDITRHMTSYHRNELFAKLEADAFEDSKRKRRRGATITAAGASVVDISQKRSVGA